MVDVNIRGCEGIGIEMFISDIYIASSLKDINILRSCDSNRNRNFEMEFELLDPSRPSEGPCPNALLDPGQAFAQPPPSPHPGEADRRGTR